MIDSFRGEYRWLSNFYLADVVYEGRTYMSAEHAFQAAKTLRPSQRRLIATSATPGRAKRLGRQVSLRRDWEDVKIGVMAEVLLDKFTRHENLRAALLATGDQELIEGNHWHDNFFGSCWCDACESIEGENWLGKTLMALREELQ